MKINWNLRKQNVLFWLQIALAVITPVLAYAGLSFEDITSWGTLFNLILNALTNPYVLGLIAVSVWNAINDPTVPGLGDSETALARVNLEDAK